MGVLDSVFASSRMKTIVTQYLFQDNINVTDRNKMKNLNNAKEFDVFGTKFFPVWSGGGRSVDWHQDSHYFGSANAPDILSCAIYLEDTDRENGCLRIVPSSHASGVEYEHVPGVGEWRQGEWISDRSIADIEMQTGHQAQDVAVPAGSVVIFDARLVHGAYPNSSPDRTRFSFFAHYCPTNLNFSWRGVDFSFPTYKDRHRICVTPLSDEA